jgi:pimeloyl-ACP methyl ester carboxylesterase
MAIVESPLAAFPPTGWFVTSDGVQIPYRARGEGAPLVMVHGWSQSGAMFQHQLERLSEQFTVIVPDIRGHGDAARARTGLRMARLAKDLAELMDHLGFGRAHLLGWSMGASVLWAFIDLFGTARVDRFVFVDQPSMLTRLPEMDEEAAADAGALFTPAQIYDLRAALRSTNGEAVRAGFVAGMVTKQIPADLYGWLLAENARTPLDVAAELLVSHCTHDWRDVLARIDRPSLVIGGAVSHVPPRSQRYLHRRIANSVYHEFGVDEGGAHFPFLEAPDAFNRVVAGFLNSH